MHSSTSLMLSSLLLCKVVVLVIQSSVVNTIYLACTEIESDGAYCAIRFCY